MSGTNPAVNIPHYGSTSQAWIEWHKSLRRLYNKAQANTLFAQAVAAGRMSDAANTRALRDYLRSQGYQMYGDDMFEDFYDEAAGTYDSIGQGFATLGNLAILGVFVVALIIGLVIWKLLK